MIEIGWDSPDENILTWVFVGKWTSKTFLTALRENKKLLQSADHSVIVTLDLRKAREPENLMGLVTKVLSYPAYNVQRVIVIGSVAKWRSLYALALYITGSSTICFEFVESPDDIQIAYS